MIKLSIFLTRRADLTHEEFVDYWTQKHPVRRYVQLLPTDDEIPGVATAATAVASDEENFLDRAQTRFLYAAEHPIFG